MVYPGDLNSLLESSDIVGNIRFSHPTLYVFPGGQGDAALFGINGFNMLGMRCLKEINSIIYQFYSIAKRVFNLFLFSLFYRTHSQLMAVFHEKLASGTLYDISIVSMRY
jgi:hypothetical protein